MSSLFFVFEAYVELGNTVKPVYNGHLRFLKKASAITRCPLYRVLDFLGKKWQQELREGFFSYNTSKKYNKYILKSKETSNVTF